MDLTTEARANTLLEIDATVSGTDAIIATLITEVSFEVETALSRHVEQIVRVDQQNIEPGQKTVLLKGYPVVSSVTIFNDINRDFDSDSFSSDEFYLNADRGIITVDLRTLVFGPGVLQVTYKGGMAATTSAFISAFPDLSTAIDHQVGFLYQRRRHIGQNSISAEGGSVSMTASTDWLPILSKAVARHSRMVATR